MLLPRERVKLRKKVFLKRCTLSCTWRFSAFPTTTAGSVKAVVFQRMAKGGCKRSVHRRGIAHKTVGGEGAGGGTGKIRKVAGKKGKKGGEVSPLFPFPFLHLLFLVEHALSLLFLLLLTPPKGTPIFFPLPFYTIPFPLSSSFFFSGRSSGGGNFTRSISSIIGHRFHAVRNPPHPTPPPRHPSRGKRARVSPISPDGETTVSGGGYCQAAANPVPLIFTAPP